MRESPVFGLISRAAGTLFIDRSRKRAVLEMAEKMNETLRAGESVLFFPEGTTGEGRVLLPFYANLFASAVATEAELIPVVIRYTQKGKVTTIPSYAGNIPLFTVMKRIVFSSGLEAEVQVLEPISSAGVDRKTLCAQTSAVMSAALGVPDATAAKEEAVRQRREAALKHD